MERIKTGFYCGNFEVEIETEHHDIYFVHTKHSDVYIQVTNNNVVYLPFKHLLSEIYIFSKQFKEIIKKDKEILKAINEAIKLIEYSKHFIDFCDEVRAIYKM